jgi:hypothetical protein
VQTSKRLVYKGYTCARRSEEELVIVSVEVSVEAGQLSWRQVWVIGRLVVFILELISPTTYIICALVACLQLQLLGPSARPLTLVFPFCPC